SGPIGQPIVVSVYVILTAPSSMATSYTRPRSTMLIPSSGSMTFLRASSTASSVDSPCKGASDGPPEASSIPARSSAISRIPRSILSALGLGPPGEEPDVDADPDRRRPSRYQGWPPLRPLHHRRGRDRGRGRERR